MILAELLGKIVKNHPLQEPIRLQDLENSACSQTVKKIKVYFYLFFFCKLRSSDFFSFFNFPQSLLINIVILAQGIVLC